MEVVNNNYNNNFAGLVFLDSYVKMPLMELPVRSVAITLENSKQILLSPGSNLKSSDFELLDNVTDIIAPNLFHSGGILNATSYFKSSTIWGSPGCSTLKPNIKWDKELSLINWDFKDEFQLHLIEGMPKVNEFIFYHPKSKSLIVTDFCFNLDNVTGLGPKIILSLFDTYKKFGISKFFLKFIKDDLKFKKSVNELFNFDFDNIIVSHGSNIIGGAKDKLKLALLERKIIINV